MCWLYFVAAYTKCCCVRVVTLLLYVRRNPCRGLSYYFSKRDRDKYWWLTCTRSRVSMTWKCCEETRKNGGAREEEEEAWEDIGRQQGNCAVRNFLISIVTCRAYSLLLFHMQLQLLCWILLQFDYIYILQCSVVYITTLPLRIGKCDKLYCNLR